MKARLKYFFLFFILLLIEILIGAFLKGGFIRAYGGDILVIPLLYALIRSVFPQNTVQTARYLPVGLLFLGIFTECMQAIHLADLLGIQNPIIRIVIGSTFDLLDILCYAVGTILIYFSGVLRKFKLELQVFY